MTPTLNWREIERLVREISPSIVGSFVDRIVVPERPQFKARFLKGEWAIRMVSRSGDGVLLISVRARHPYLSWVGGKGPKAATIATRSPFDLAASKLLKGAKLEKIAPLPHERTVVLTFKTDDQPIALVLILIPAQPEALIVRPVLSRGGWPILARTRMKLKNAEPIDSVFMLPDPNRLAPELAIREELFAPPGWSQTLEVALNQEALGERICALQSKLQEKITQADQRGRQSRVAEKTALSEPNWQLFGDLLKASMSHPPSTSKTHHRTLLDYSTNQFHEVPCDPQLDVRAQVEKFYAMAKRKQRRLNEAKLRAESMEALAARLKTTLQSLKQLDPKNLQTAWNELEKIERSQGEGSVQTTTPARGAKARAWLGKAFLSRDRLLIWVGRSRDENLELTFKHSRAHDIWMHVRGRPGAHVVVPLNPGKSIPLDTLLDAAQLCIYYSGGQNWGKTEVDYTPKKHVKRIKDSTEASYTHNKTLIVEPDRDRLKQLLDQHEE